MTLLCLKPVLRLSLVILTGVSLSACATVYGDRGADLENPIKDIASFGGLATSVPEAKDFVVESRTEALSYIPIGAPDSGPDGRKKPLTAEELLLLQKRLEAAQRQNSSLPADE